MGYIIFKFLINYLNTQSIYFWFVIVDYCVYIDSFCNWNSCVLADATISAHLDVMIILLMLARFPIHLIYFLGHSLTHSIFTLIRCIFLLALLLYKEAEEEAAQLRRQLHQRWARIWWRMERRSACLSSIVRLSLCVSFNLPTHLYVDLSFDLVQLNKK